MEQDESGRGGLGGGDGSLDGIEVVAIDGARNVSVANPTVEFTTVDTTGGTTAHFRRTSGACPRR